MIMVRASYDVVCFPSEELYSSDALAWHHDLLLHPVQSSIPVTGVQSDMNRKDPHYYCAPSVGGGCDGQCSQHLWPHSTTEESPFAKRRCEGAGGKALFLHEAHL